MGSDPYLGWHIYLKPTPTITEQVDKIRLKNSSSLGLVSTKIHQEY